MRKRVKEGGHDIPQKIITRRFYKSVHNFVNLYLPIADIWFLVDNSSKIGQLVVSYDGVQVFVQKEDLWKTIKRQAKSGKI